MLKSRCNIRYCTKIDAWSTGLPAGLLLLLLLLLLPLAAWGKAHADRSAGTIAASTIAAGTIAAGTAVDSIARTTLALSATAAPWGYDGHRIICEIAYRNLTDAARTAVDELVSGDPEEPFKDFREACTWADEVRGRREAAYDSFSTAHYVNIERGSSGFDLARDCKGTFCVVEAIREQTAILADPTSPLGQRRDALKFVAHFVGDIHQPLHAGYLDDRGGNSVRVLIKGDDNSLHSFWDSGFLTRRGGTWQDMARDLRYDIRAIDRTLWSSNDPAAWANESFRIVEDHVYVFPLSPEVEDEYYFRNIHTVEEQLKKAGLRLANLLNETLD